MCLCAPCINTSLGIGERIGGATARPDGGRTRAKVGGLNSRKAVPRRASQIALTLSARSRRRGWGPRRRPARLGPGSEGARSSCRADHGRPPEASARATASDGFRLDRVDPCHTVGQRFSRAHLRQNSGGQLQFTRPPTRPAVPECDGLRTSTKDGQIPVDRLGLKVTH